MVIERTLVDERFIHEAVLGARLSWASSHKSDSALLWGARWEDRQTLDIGPDDETLLKKLLTGASGEDKFLRCIPVSMRVTAPLKWWHDFDQYTFAVTNSESLMHYTKGRGELPWFKFSPATDPQVVERVNVLFRVWAASGGRGNSNSPEWEAFQDSIPRGFLYEKHVFTNYATLRLAYFQRRNHRQGDWREFCNWMETLPHWWLITTEKTNGKAKN